MTFILKFFIASVLVATHPADFNTLKNCQEVGKAILEQNNHLKELNFTCEKK